MSNTYAFVNEHEAAECGALMEEAQQNPWPARLDDVELPCLCPSGTHRAWFVVDTEDPDGVLASIPPKFRAGTTVHSLAVAVIGTSFPTA